MKYMLYLDESGNFKDNGKSYKASIVAGYLIKGNSLSEAAAANLLREVQCSNTAFSKININNFHGMESINSDTVEFMTKVMERLSKKGATLVSFINEKSRKLINTDITYVNVFSEGIMQLIKHLMAQNSGHVELNIYYAHRIYVSAKEQTGEIKRIEEEQYKDRIDERIILRLANYPQSMRDKIKYTLKTGNAKKEPLLMLADIANGVLRGLKSQLTPDQKIRLNALPQLKFKTLENTGWETIQRILAEGNVADAIFRWYGEFYDELNPKYKELFKTTLQTRLLDIGEGLRKVQHNIFSQYVKTLVDNRNYSSAKLLLKRVCDDYIKILKRNRIDDDLFEMDIHFFLLTIATHEGNIDVENKEIEICRHIFSKLPYTWENLDYYLSYKLREIEHFNNIFDFGNAITGASKLINILSNTVDVIQMIDELGSFADNVKSTTLAKVYNARGRYRCFASSDIAADYDSISGDLHKAKDNFVNDGDISRVYQSLSLLEEMKENYSAAIDNLKLAAGLSTHDSIDKLASSLYVNERLNSFMLTRYSSIMASIAFRDKSTAVEMFTVLAKYGIFDLIYNDNKVQYPNTVTKWKIGTCLALQGNNRAQKAYNNAIIQSLANPKQYTIFAQGLAMWAEKLALVKMGSKYGLDIFALKNKYLEFEMLIPDSMKKYFSEWKSELRSCCLISQGEARERLLKLSQTVPII